jgi:flagellar biosynthesis protein FlhG
MEGSVKPADFILNGTPPVSPGSLEDHPFEGIASTSTRRIKQIWAIGGGKGGVGKSMIASSLAVSLSRQGQHVVAVDLDLGGANLHTTLGVDLPKLGLSDFLSGRQDRLETCLTATHVNGLQLLSGAQDSLRVAQISIARKRALLQSLLRLDADYLVLDLGAGTADHTLDFYLFADIGIVSLLPEPTSIENGYRFIKSTYFRRLLLSPHLAEVRHLIDAAQDAKNPLGIKTPSDLFREVNKLSPEAGMRLKEEIENFRPKLIINQARTQTDVDIGFSVKTVCKKYFGIDMDYVGYLDYDSSVWQAVRRKRPLMLEFPNSRLVSSFERIAHYLVKRHGHVRCDLY